MHEQDLIADPNVQQFTVLCVTETNVKTNTRQSFILAYQMVMEQTKHGLAIFVKYVFTFTDMYTVSISRY